MMTIAGYMIDAAITEEHTFEADVTEHPVERGTSIVDHVRIKPLTISVEGIVSDTPIGLMADERNAAQGTAQVGQIQVLNSQPSVDAYAFLKQIFQAREPVTIKTSLQTFDDMVLQSLSAPRSASDGDSLRFRATFRQVVFATNERTYVEVGTPRAKAKEDRGTKIPERYNHDAVEEDGWFTAKDPDKPSESIIYDLAHKG